MKVKIDNAEINEEVEGSDALTSAASQFALSQLVASSAGGKARSACLRPGGSVAVEGTVRFSFEAHQPESGKGVDVVQNHASDPWALLAIIAERANLDDDKIAALVAAAKAVTDTSKGDDEAAAAAAKAKISGIKDRVSAADIDLFGTSTKPKAGRLKVVRREFEILDL